LVEQRVEEPRVGGSISKLGAMLLSSVIVHAKERISKR
jgi:hypothetical protein